MKIVNQTKKTILSDDAVEAKSFLDKSLGLIDLSKPRTLIISTRFGIHTFGMKEKIDVIVLNQYGKVMKLKHDIKPNAIFTWKPKYSLIIELPPGSLLRSNTTTGDIIQIIE